MMMMMMMTMNKLIRYVARIKKFVGPLASPVVPVYNGYTTPAVASP